MVTQSDIELIKAELNLIKAMLQEIRTSQSNVENTVQTIIEKTEAKFNSLKDNPTAMMFAQSLGLEL